MNDPGDSNRKLDRKSVERIIQRAAELQANDHDVGDGLTETELLSLGTDVGIPKHLMRRAMLEEQTQSTSRIVTGVVPWLFGPTRVSAARVLPRPAYEVEQELEHWMAAIELLSVKRRFANSTSWETRKDLLSTVKRAFDFRGVGYKLAKVNEVAGEVTKLEAGNCHVSLVADISNLKRQRVAGTGALTLTGGLMTATGAVLGFALPVAFLPLVVGAAIGVVASRARQGEPARVQVALEQILDRLEHREIRIEPEKKSVGPGAILQIADEIKRNIRSLPINKSKGPINRPRS